MRFLDSILRIKRCQYCLSRLIRVSNDDRGGRPYVHWPHVQYTVYDCSKCANYSQFYDGTGKFVQYHFIRSINGKEYILNVFLSPKPQTILMHRHGITNSMLYDATCNIMEAISVTPQNVNAKIKHLLVFS